MSPIYRPNIFVGDVKGMDSDESPLDFFDKGLAKYPSTSTVNFLESDLGPGDCIYVPAYYYVQSQTLGDSNYKDNKIGTGQSMIVTHQYESHSAMVDMVFRGIDNKDWMDDETNKVDDMLKGYLGDIF